MSWGERSCGNKPCPIPDECNPQTCNVDCRKYEWDGKTKPDSTPHSTKGVTKRWLQDECITDPSIALAKKRLEKYDNKPMSPETRARAKARRNKSNKHKKRSR